MAVHLVWLHNPPDAATGTQVSARTASASAQAAAKKLGATLALDLVDFDPELRAAMAYVFGNVFICKARRTHCIEQYSIVQMRPATNWLASQTFHVSVLFLLP